MYKLESNGLLLVARQPQPAVRARVTESSEEALLVQAVRHGEQEAFAKLYSLYAPMVHGIVLARVPWGEVDDLVQDVFLVALKKLATLRDNAAFGAWLAMIARNRAMDFHRRRRETEELTDDIATAQGSSEADREAANVLEVICGLPEAYRETLVLRLVEGMTGPEIADRTGLTPASVRVNLHRGMKLLREKLGMEEQL
ncbi:MAG TPA: sigma-70 family RNA polymerase sigma factor [Blastocatellia bacterium]|nr:sigma-70 family RNA polymerase sigma factor [Blastocatellia bacterium]